MPLSISRPALALLIVAVSGSTSFLGHDARRPVAASGNIAAAAMSPEMQDALPPPPQPQDAAPPAPAPVTEPLFTAAQLETALGPIALYPDALVAQILAAATYPLEVVQAARWVNEHPDLTGLDGQPWDPSVMAVARFKSVLTMMDQNLQWTIQLGDAFRAQPADVMDAVQRLRAKAHAAGSLQTTPQQQVIIDDSVPAGQAQAIRIVPAQPEVIYVPIYDPQVVYVPQVEYVYEPYPVYTGTVYTGGAYVSSYCPPRWYAPVWDAAYIGARWDSTWGFAFSIGYSWGSWSTIDCDWYGRRVCYRDWNDYGWCGWRSDYKHRGHGGHHGDHHGGGHDGHHGGGGDHDGRHDDGFDRQGAIASADGVKSIDARRIGAAGDRAWRHGENAAAARRTGTFAGAPLVTTAAGPQRSTSFDAGPGRAVRVAGGGSDRGSGSSPGVVRLAAPPSNIPPAATVVTPRSPADSPVRVAQGEAPPTSRRGTFSQGSRETPAVGSSTRSTREIVEMQSPVRSSAPSPTVRRGTFNIGGADVGSSVAGPVRSAPTITPAPPSRSMQSAPAPSPSRVSAPSRSSSASASRSSSSSRPSASRPSGSSRPSQTMGPTRSSAAPSAPAATRTGTFSRGKR